MDEFLNSWYGIAIVLTFDIVALVAVVCLTYRWFFKRVFDVLVSGVCLVFTSPLFLAVAIRGKKFKKETDGAIDSLTEKQIRVGKKEKVIVLSKFKSRDENGELLGWYGRWLENWKLCELPKLIDVFFGRLSFIGVKAMLRSEAEFVEDEVDKDRFSVRPGLISPLVCVGDKDTNFEEMLLVDKKYAWLFSFFGDCKIFFAWLLNKIRGEGKAYLGETTSSYAEYLYKNEQITLDDYTVACELDNELE